MKEKIEGFVKALPKIKVHNIATPFKVVLYVWVSIVLGLVVAYFAFWLSLCATGKAMLSDLLLLIKEMTGATMIAAIGVVCSFFVDNDNDGIPDRFDSEVKNNGKD